MVRIEAKKHWNIPASSKWVQGWMKRMGLTMRIRTTYKEVSTERMKVLKQQYQAKVADFFHFYSHHNILNCDETLVFYGAPRIE